MNWKTNWEEKLLNEFQSCSWDSVEELLKDSYKIALSDVNYEHQYTHLILFNLKQLAEYGIEKISFKQWKSFRAYVQDAKRKDINIEDLFNK